MKILLLGATGQVGWELHRTLSVLGELITTSRTGSTGLVLDAGDLEALQATLDTVAPDVIVNAIAYTAVDRAETEVEQAMRLNGEVPHLVGAWAAAHGALVIHYSTDYVFDGTKVGPYIETDVPNPLNVYGRSKLAGDVALLQTGCAAIILRVSWVYGLRGHNFLLTMRRLMDERDELRIVDDQLGAPTWCRTIAQVTANVLTTIPPGQEAREALCGVYHLSPAGRTTWFGFAMAIRDLLGLACVLHPIPTDEYPLPARRPMNSSMDSTRLQAIFRLRLPSWDQDLELCLDR